MKKIVYVMQVDWNWIKQRPHFIAEELGKNHHITVMYQHRYSRTGYQKRDSGGLDIKPVYVIPKGDRFPVLRGINRKLKAAAIRAQVRRSGADCLYLTFPDQVDAISPKFRGQVIYDCMDNHPAFCADPAQRQAMEQQEKALIQRADQVLVTSENLKQALIARYGQEQEHKMVLVRNGYNGELLDLSQMPAPAAQPYTLAYFGTISSWFNFDFVEKSLADFPNIEYLLMGPADAPIPQHERIRYIGTVEHSELANVTKDAQCLIMPFVRSEIIDAVDPVKLYEYINFGKNILCIQYPEVERFDPFVYFYSDYESYKAQLAALTATDQVKYTNAQREAFLLENSWLSRVSLIENLL